MKLGEQLFLAFRSYGQVFRTLDKYHLWSVLILPSIMSLIIAIVIGIFAWISSDDILRYFIGKYRFVDYDSSVGNLFEIVVTVAIRGLTFFLYLKLYRYLILILLSPVFINISNVLYKKVVGEENKMNIWAYCFCSFRSIELSLRNFALDLLLTLLLLILSIIILWIVPLIPILILVAESYFFAVVLMDYRYEMEGIPMKESIRRCREVPGIPIGIGLIFNLILLVPLLGVMFGPVLALIASEESINQLKKPN